MTTAADLIAQREVEGINLVDLKSVVRKHDGIGCFRMPTIGEVSFGDVIECREKYANGEVIEAMCIALGCWPEFILSKPDDEFLGFWRHLEDELLKSAEMEQGLSAADDPKLIEAGIHKMGAFEEYNAIDALAGGDLLKWDEVKSRPYQECFVKLMKNKVEGEISKKYQKLLSGRKSTI